MSCNQSVTVYEKPLAHLGLPDWNARLTQLRSTADVRRADSFALRHSARTLRNETSINTDWDTYHNNVRLEDRVAELKKWRITMEECMARLEREIALLKDEKASTERELEGLVVPLTVVSECLSSRDGRLEAELTYDDADTELKKELCLVENNQKLLQDQCHSAWEKLNRLNEVKFKVGLEIDNKREAESIDISQLALDKYCANITYKPDPLRVPKNSCTYEGWLAHVEHMKLLADTELADTYAMRESLFVSREKSRNILKTQQNWADHTLRKRIYETQRARNELQWQRMKMIEEMEKCLAEIAALEQSYMDKVNALKLAETRQENRAQRSGLELCCDKAYKGLCDEILQLRKTMSDLMEKINCAKTTYNALEAHLLRIDTDLGNKEHALMTDIRAIDLRMRLRSGDCSESKTQTDRNIILTQMDKEVPAN